MFNENMNGQKLDAKGAQWYPLKLDYPEGDGE